ncbi:aromatic hydrocarbon degradation protein [Parabacteroides sp. Marseille-P3160]|uniref:aromatic hydrocarbon degradation protein n=1 Tax=Parabacteroides sp. Marseille-P3160 TaxID=1917887 RepID=UPI0009B9DB37|nr:aromatic hydrocarbon degradation protein [Parabacteroides sp. Marseille-P3160]
MKKKIGLFLSLAICPLMYISAGGLLTNTNQHARFIRMVALDASTSIDAAYYNPAGLVMLTDGFHFGFTNQSAFQTRTITTTFPLFAPTYGTPTKEFEGEASAPIIPSLQAAYKTGKWVLSGNLAVSGGGGKATFNHGLPSFESGMAMVPAIIQQVGAALQPMGISLGSDKYSVDQYMTGSSFIYGAQLGGSYAINEHLSVYGGFRLNIVNNNYEGHLRDLKVNLTSNNIGYVIPGLADYDGSMASPATVLELAKRNATEETKQKIELLQAASKDGVYLDCDQSGWGISPILSANYHWEKLNVGVKYEFKTPLNVENKTKIDGTGMFANGVNTPHDIPALLTVGASYQLLPQLSLNVGYHHFFDSDAKMANDKQKYINGGTNEYLTGVEYRIDRMFLVSAGGQITRQGLKDEYQTDLSFSLNSYSIGLGGAVNVTKDILINVGYFWTTYSDWTKEMTNYGGSGLAGKDVFSRTNKVFAAGVDFSF